MNALGLTVDESFVRRVVAISGGLPHYTHLVSQHAARLCMQRDTELVGADLFGEAVPLAPEIEVGQRSPGNATGYLESASICVRLS